MMSSSRIAHCPAYWTAMQQLDKLLQDTGSSVECILRSYTVSSARASGPEVLDVRTSLSMGIAPASYNNRTEETQTNTFYKDDVSAGNLGPTQFQGSFNNIIQCLDVQNWCSQKQPSPTVHKKSSDVLVSNDEGALSNEDALRGLLEEIKKNVCDWLFRHKTILQDKPSRSATHIVSPGLCLPNGAPSLVGFEKDQRPIMSMSSLGRNTSGDGLQAHQTRKEEEKRQGDACTKQTERGKEGEIVQQNQDEESRGGLLLQRDKVAHGFSLDSGEVEKSVHLDNVVNDITHQSQSDEQPMMVQPQDVAAKDPAAHLSLQGSNAGVASSTAANAGSTPLLKEKESAAESFLTPTSKDNNLPITKWTPPASAVKTINKSLSFPQAAVEVVTSADWLPEGWVTELKTRSRGNSAGTKDKYYVDPVSHRRFRSRKEVIAYLERDKLKSSDDSPGTSPVKKFPAPDLLPNKSSKKAKLKKIGTPSASAVPPPKVPSIASTGPLGNAFMSPFRTGQPSEWLAYESLTNLPFPMYDPFYYRDFSANKSSSDKGSHVSTRPWFFTGPEASWNPFMDRGSSGKSGDRGRDYESYFSTPSYPFDVGSKPSAGGAKKLSKRKSAGL